MTVSTEPAPVLTGYEAVERFYVKRGRQGGRTVYTLDVTPVAIAQGFLAKPDPDKKVEGQRDLIPRHAQQSLGFVGIP